MKFSYNKKALAIAASVIVVLIIAGLIRFVFFSADEVLSGADKGPPPAVVVVDAARLMTIAPHTELPGSVVSLRDATIASEIAGKILSVKYIGSEIQAGQSIAEIDPTNAKQNIDQRRAELMRLESLLSYHSEFYDRAAVEDDKLDILGVSKIGIAELKSNRDTAKADVARAKAALKSAENDLNRTSIMAPFSGTIVGQAIQQGEYAQVGSPIARLVDTTNLEVSTRIPASLVQPIKPGTLIKISGMGTTIEAPLRVLVPVGDEISRTMEVRIQLSESNFLVGMPVRVSIPSAAPKQVIAVPRDAVTLRTGTQFIFVVKDGNAHRREVQLGYAEADMIEVIGDVAPEDTVIVRGAERLRDGQAVTWQEQKADAAVSLSDEP